MNWLALHIDTNHLGLDTVEALLSGLGIDGIAVEDEEEFQDFLAENRDAWDYVDEDLEKAMRGRSRVTFYVEENETGFSQMAQVRIALQSLKENRKDLGSLLMTVDKLKNEDWETSWKQYYELSPVGGKLLITPEWLKDTIPEGETRIPLLLDPGLTFGTGNHATTRLCLELLEGIVKGGEKVLDLGCGSGILSIAARLLGAREALAIDIDDKCERVAVENAALNCITGDGYRVRIGNVLSDEALQQEIGSGWDIALANIVADVVIPLSGMVARFVKPGGYFLCSGIIDHRASETESALKDAGLTVLEHRSASDWHAFLCRLPE